MWSWKAPVRSALSLGLAIGVVAPSLEAQLDPQLRGTAEDREHLTRLATGCAAKSDAFEAAWRRLIIDGVPIFVSRDDPRVTFIGAFLDGKEPHRIDLDHLDRFPEIPDRAAGPSVRPGNLPRWGSTLCTTLAHEIAEATYAEEWKAGPAGFDRSHRYAIGVENRVRRDLGQTPCRSKRWRMNEKDRIPHGDHLDIFVTFGNHTERFHLVAPPDLLRISYELGSPEACQASDFDVSLSERP